MVFSRQLCAVGANKGNQFARGDLESLFTLDANLELIGLDENHAFAVIACLQAMGSTQPPRVCFMLSEQFNFSIRAPNCQLCQLNPE